LTDGIEWMGAEGEDEGMVRYSQVRSRAYAYMVVTS